MNLFNRSAAKSSRKGKSGGKSRSKSGRKSATRKGRSGSSMPNPVMPWLIGAAIVVVVAGVGLLKWARTGTGQATLLSLGSQKMFGDVQATVEEALVEVLPGAGSGAEGDHDWPAPQFGPTAAVRCRAVPVQADIPWWDLQVQVAEAAESRGARVLWAERIPSHRPKPGGQIPDPAETDLLRMDVGVPGRPTHTLVLYRAGRRPDVRWGGGPRSLAWSQLAGGQGPVVALVIDDWGYSKSEAARSILSLPVPVTMAVLPGLPYSRYFALKGTDLVLPFDMARASGQAASKPESSRQQRLDLGCFVEVHTGSQEGAVPSKRREILLHLPMEPQGYPDPDPGDGAVMVGMEEEAIGARVDEALAALPTVTGVNNHMGSAATSDQPTMAALMKALRRRDLLFIDSLTSAQSVGYAEAQKAGLPTAKNRIFLDFDNKNRTTIKANLDVLVRSARSSGFALGICHPHRATAEVLTREIPRLVQEGVRFVTVSELLALKELAQAAAEGS